MKYINLLINQTGQTPASTISSKEIVRNLDEMLEQLLIVNIELFLVY